MIVRRKYLKNAASVLLRGSYEQSSLQLPWLLGASRATSMTSLTQGGLFIGPNPESVTVTLALEALGG